MIKLQSKNQLLIRIKNTNKTLINNLINHLKINKIIHHFNQQLKTLKIPTNHLLN